MRTHPDGDLNAERLDDKYNPEGNGEHPQFTREMWREAVANDYTLSGYWYWVECQIAEWEQDDEPPLRQVGDDISTLPVLSLAPPKSWSQRIGIIDQHGKEVASVRVRKDYDCEAVARRLVASFNLCNHNQEP